MGPPLAGACAGVRDQLLAEGSWGDSNTPRDRMHAAGCDAEADFNHDPTSDRLFSAALTALVAAVVLVLMVVVGFTVLVAKLFGLIAFALAPFALLGGVLPGAGREILWAWLTWLLRVVAVVVGMAWLLSLLLLCSGALLDLPQVSLQERFGVLLVLVLGLFVLRRQIVTAGTHLAGRARQAMAGTRFGAGHRAATGGWTPGPTGGG